MRGTERRTARGFLLVYVLMVVAVLAVVSMLLLESAENGAVDARQVEVKNDSFDAAEAGLNAALEALDLSLTQSTSRSATLSNGYHYRYHIHPNFSGSLPVTIDDPGEGSEGDDQSGDDRGGGGSGGSGGSGGGGGSGGSGSGDNHGRGQGDQVTLPPGGAVIVSVGAGPNGERVTTLEAAVTADVAQLSYPQYAIITGLNIQGNYTAALTMPAGVGGGNGNNGVGLGGGGGNNGVGGGNSGSAATAGVHANGTITARATRAFQTDAEASGRTNTLPPRTTRADQVPLPMVSQFDYMVASYKNQASSPGAMGNLYVAQGAPLQTNYDCVAPQLAQGCLLFYDGPLDLVSQLTTFTGQWTMVVNGNLTLSGGAALDFHARPSLLIVNGNAYVSGTGPTTAYLQVKGSTSLSGNVQFTGAIMSLGSLTFDDGSAGGFTYDPTVIPPGRAMVGLVKIISYAEY